MSFIDELTNNLKDISGNLEYVTKKVKENSIEIKRQTKLRLEISNENRHLGKLYQELGQKYYNLKKYGNTSFNDEDYIKNIDISIARIESLKTQLNDKFDTSKNGYKGEVENSGDFVYIKDESYEENLPDQEVSNKEDKVVYFKEEDLED